MKWIRITSAEQIPLREGRSVRVDDVEIAIFNLGDRFVAVDNACPHRGGPLCDGIVSGATVASEQFRGQPVTAIFVLCGVYRFSSRRSSSIPVRMASCTPKRQNSVPTQVFTIRTPLV